MSRPPKISGAEWQVMQAVWAGEGPLSATRIVESLAPRTGWNPRTIKTMLIRLVKKGALRYSAQGKRYLYRPAVTRASCVRDESRSFLQRVFGGKVGPMLAHFVEDAKLTPRQIDELRRLLDGTDR